MTEALNKAIAKAVAAREAAQQTVRDVLAREQAACKHERVVHLPWRPGQCLGPSNARRMCLTCRLEEEADSIGDSDYHFTILQTDGWHKTIPFENFMALRISEASINGPLGKKAKAA